MLYLTRAPPSVAIVKTEGLYRRPVGQRQRGFINEGLEEAYISY